MENVRIIYTSNHTIDGTGGGAIVSTVYKGVIEEYCREVKCEFLSYAKDSKASRSIMAKAQSFVPRLSQRVMRVFGICESTRYMIHNESLSERDLVILDGSLTYGAWRFLVASGCKFVVVHHNFEWDHWKDVGGSAVHRLFYGTACYLNQMACWHAASANWTLTQEDGRKLQCNFGYRPFFRTGIGRRNEDSKRKLCTSCEDIGIAITANFEQDASFQSVYEVLSSLDRYQNYSRVRFRIVLAGRRASRFSTCCDFRERLRVELCESPQDVVAAIMGCKIYLNPCTHGSGMKIRVSDGLFAGCLVICHIKNSYGYNELPSSAFQVYSSEAGLWQRLDRAVGLVVSNALNREEIFAVAERHFGLQAFYRKISVALDSVLQENAFENRII